MLQGSNYLLQFYFQDDRVRDTSQECCEDQLMFARSLENKMLGKYMWAWVSGGF